MNDHSKPKIGERVVDRGGDGVIVQTYERDGVGECFVVRWDPELPDLLAVVLTTLTARNYTPLTSKGVVNFGKWRMMT
jgi:hypothetical protein